MAPIRLDGRTLEGGGQLLRNAIALSALTRTPIEISAIRGNRPGGGGLKAQHLTAVEWLADACGASVKGAEKGSKEIVFKPGKSGKRGEGVKWWEDKVDGVREVKIDIGSLGSVFLVFQAVLPFLLFSSTNADTQSTVRLEITGGTNVSHSPSAEYVAQVLLPTLVEHLGIPPISLAIPTRGWSTGSTELGTAVFTLTPLPHSHSLQMFHLPPPGDLKSISISLFAPTEGTRNLLRDTTLSALWREWPEAEHIITLAEPSGHEKRLYLLLVAQTESGCRLGADWLYDRKIKKGSVADLNNAVGTLAKTVVRRLKEELERGGSVDEHMQDQLVVFQALASGRSIVMGGGDEEGGTLHTKTARWVCEEILGVEWEVGAGLCREGVGLRCGGG